MNPENGLARSSFGTRKAKGETGSWTKDQFPGNRYSDEEIKGKASEEIIKKHEIEDDCRTNYKDQARENQ